MNTPQTVAVVLNVLFGAMALSAHAHVVIDNPRAEAAANFRATFKVGHGCEGLPTKTLTIAIPEGVNQAKPMPKPGWTLNTKTEKLATPYEYHGKKVDTRVSEISWSGGALADSHYDEFVVLIRTPERAGKVYFKTTQLCAEGGKQGRWDWHDIAPPGKTRRDMKAPAPELEVVPKAAGVPAAGSAPSTTEHRH
jgi:uncharacterized protein YcnI